MENLNLSQFTPEQLAAMAQAIKSQQLALARANKPRKPITFKLCGGNGKYVYVQGGKLGKGFGAWGSQLLELFKDEQAMHELKSMLIEKEDFLTKKDLTDPLADII